MRIKQINDEKLNNSVHEFAIHKKHHGNTSNDLNLHEISLAHSDHSKSLIKGIDDKEINQKKKELLDKKRYDQMNKNYNQHPHKGGIQMPSVTGKKADDRDQGGAGSDHDTHEPKLDSNVQLNLENLTKIDEKLQHLIDNLKVNKINNIS